MSKRIFSVFLVFAVFLCAVAALSLRTALPGHASSYIYIDSEADWEAFIAGSSASANPSSTCCYQNTTVVLNTDLYFYRRNEDPAYAGAKNYVQLRFEGTFEGNNHALVGLRYDTESSVALFYSIGLSGVVRNLNIVDLSVSSGENAAGIALYNYGILSDVRVQGMMNAVKGGGIVYTNYPGLIENCVSAVENNGCTEFGAIVYENKIVHSDGMDYFGTVENTYNVTPGQDYVKDEGSKIIMPADTLLDDGFADDVFELYHLRYRPSEVLAGIALRHPGMSVSMRHDINLYSQPSGWVETIVADYPLSDCYGFYNTDNSGLPAPSLSGFTEPIHTPLLPDTLKLSGTGTAEDPYIFFDGEGTAASPYLLYTAADLQRMDYLYAHREDWALFGLQADSVLCFSLRKDIGLLSGSDSYYDIKFNDFDGVFDGGGKSISGIMDGLFGTILQGGLVKDLVIRGEIRTDGRALAAQANFGTIHGVAATVSFANAENTHAAGLTYTNHNDISGCSVNVVFSGSGSNASAVFGNEGENAHLYGVRSIAGGLPFLYSQSAANSVAGCWHDNAVWYGEDETLFPYQSIAYYSGTQHFQPGTDPYQLLDAANPVSGWGWTQQANYNWCVLAGSTEERFALRLDADVRSYKTTGRIRFSDGSYEFFKKLTYTPEGHLVDLESIVNSESLPPYTWTYTNSRGEVFARTDNFPNAALNEAIVDVGFYDIYFEIPPTTEKTRMKGHARIEIEKKHIQYSASDIRLLLDNDGERIAVPVAGIYQNYGGSERDTLVVDGTEYDFDNLGVFVTKNGATSHYPYSSDLVCQYFTGSEISAQVFLPFCAPENSTVSYQINKYFKPDEQIFSVKPAFIRNAGTYFLTITVHSENYFDAVIEEEVVYRVFRKEVPVTPYINTADGRLPYGEAIAGYVSYSADTSMLIDFPGLNQMEFETTYFTGASIGMYSLKSKTAVLDNNYKAMQVASSFEVVRIDIPGLSAVAFSDAIRTYDGQWQSIAVSGLTGSMAVEYIYDAVATDVPPSFINAGTYRIHASVYIKKPDGSKNTNYNEAPILSAVLTIMPKTITVTVRNYTISSGDALPVCSVENFDSQLALRADGAADTFSAPVFGLNPAYSGAAGTYAIGVTGGLSNANYNVNVVCGTLTVNRVSRGTLTLPNSVKIYDGTYYQPDLSAAGACNMSGIIYYRLDGEVWTRLANAPRNTGVYKVAVPFYETEYYVAETLEASFRIDKAVLSPVFTLNGMYNKLASSLTVSSAVYSELIYSGQTFSVRLSGLPAAESFLITMSYEKEGMTITTTSGQILYADAGYYSNIRAVVSGNLNYETLTLYAGDIEYKPRTLRAAGLSPVVYTGSEITLNITASNESYILEQDRNNINITYTSIPAVIRNAGTYTVAISSGNPNYVFLSEAPDGLYTFTVNKYTAEIDLGEYRHETVYGSASSTFMRQTTYRIGQNQFTETLVYDVNLPPVVTAGTYDITGIHSTDNVDFTLCGGAGAYIVTKRTVSFAWGLSHAYDYTGTVRTDIAGYTVPNTAISNRAGNDYVGLTVSFNKNPIRDCGSYTATASVSNMNYTLDPACVSFVFSINKVPLRISANPLTIRYGDPPPAYSVTMTGLRGTDTPNAVQYQTACSYAQGNSIGTYIISVTSFSAQNYYADLSDSAGVLTVEPIEQTGIVYPDNEAVYNGLPFTYLPQVPAGATATVDVFPLHAGVYTLTATVVRDNYLPKTLSATFIVHPAIPVLELTPADIIFEGDGQCISVVQIIGSADYDGTPVAGTFSYIRPDQPLILGEQSCLIVFTPDSADYAPVSAPYTIITALEENRNICNILFGAGAEIRNGTVYAEGSQLPLVLSVTKGFDENIRMFVDGEPVENGIYTVTASGLITVEVQKNDVLISQYQYQVLLNTEIPAENPTENNNDNNPNNNGNAQIDIPAKKEIDWKLFLFITLGIAGAAGLGAGLYFLIRMKK
jgi:hypothetical protein